MHNFITAGLEDQVKGDYLEYSVATLTRALPDVRDGLIPSRRRILQTMLEQGLMPSKPYVKAARTTGMTSAWYHPHGSCYGSLVSMATSWNNMLPWVDAHGNIGSTVDPPASERYLEARLANPAVDILLDGKETWLTRPNYDSSRQEAIVLDSKVPTILLNGAEGISVGYSTKWPQHGLKDICAAVATGETLYPDFPTGVQVVKDSGLEDYVKTGSGTLRLRSVLETGTTGKTGRGKERATLTYTHLPPNTNPEKIGNQVKEALEKGRIEGISEVIDLSDRSGDRIQIIVKPGKNAKDVEQGLWDYTDLELTFAARNLCLDGGKPVTLSGSQVVSRWKEWRMDRLCSQFSHEKELKSKRLEVVIGFLKAITMIDKVVATIRKSESPKAALTALMGRPFNFTQDQAAAILEMKLRSLTGLDADTLEKEKKDLEERLKELDKLISDPKVRSRYMVSEVKTLGKKYGEPRRSPLIDPPSTPIASAAARTTKTTPVASKPRFIKVDMAKGTVQQVKGPRGAMVIDSKEKLVLMTQDGMLKKVPATFKGAISTGYSLVSLAKRELEVSSRNYLVVFELEDQVKALVMKGEDLCKVTSKGKRWLPDGAKLLHFGEGPYTVKWVSKRKKPTVLDLTVKPGKPGGKGVKVAEVKEVLSEG